MTLFSTLGRPDPTPWLLASEEPAARWIALTSLLDLPEDAPEVAAAHEAVVRDAGVQTLIGLLGDWETDGTSPGTTNPCWRPTSSSCWARWESGPMTTPASTVLLDQMLAHSDDDGRFQMFAGGRRGDAPALGKPPLRHASDRGCSPALREGWRPSSSSAP